MDTKLDRILVKNQHTQREIFYLVNSRASLNQSICTVISNLSGRSDIFLGSGNRIQNIESKKQGAKNRVIVIQKEKRQPGLFPFWITMTLFFAPCFLHLIFWVWFFTGLQTDPYFQNKNFLALESRDLSQATVVCIKVWAASFPRFWKNHP